MLSVQSINETAEEKVDLSRKLDVKVEEEVQLGNEILSNWA